MSKLISITRLLPSDLQEVQVQTSSDALVSDVIASLQYNYNLIQTALVPSKPLNTACPTCTNGKNGISKGFLLSSFKGKDFKYPCPTCKGYLLTYTQQGLLTPPINPFRSAIAVTRLLPADLIEALDYFPNGTTLDIMIASLQNNFDLPPLCNCAQCANGIDNVSTGWVTFQGTKTTCPLCGGYQLTDLQWQVKNGILSIVVPSIPLQSQQQSPQL